MPKKTAWMVYHEFEDAEFCEHFKVIGFFRTREQARTVVRNLKRRPGFADHQRGFFVGRPTLNEAAWEEGFHTCLGDTTMPEPETPFGLASVLDYEIRESEDSLWHVLHSYVDQWDRTQTKIIGLYSDLELARHAVKNLLKQPGFRSRPTGFQVDPVNLGEVAYENGF